MPSQNFLDDVFCSDEVDLPGSKASTKEVSSKAKKPPVGWSAEKSSQSALRKATGDSAAFKGIEEGGTGELTSEGPGLPFRILESFLIPNGLGTNALETVVMPFDVHRDVD
mmetsp:Transcript_94421/g.281829  ORF Transcript_94421/g.281829 Transcript_94421/m.281829 type:complete len:111 (-) Transcript_94421:148-480(-)|eukprot:CAMPEP_0175222790 /NCGR_PEP_ID=MMETSP0093-20121207/21005_1 /TAXON_ID=311494 /ORGANISM="Alexandrium monilatum, Strain CCMP3105" /LENGTH=110 /DNA_ID=CAMNT_0016516387 /DNA_START=82 /DNA_END=414 /DNA_ORIENTATION=+